MVARQLHKYWRIAIFSLLVIICIAIIFTRLYLGMHWLTDVVAGSMLGFICASIVTISYCRRLKPLSKVTIVCLLISTLLIGIIWEIGAHFPSITRAVTKSVSHEKTISMQHWWPTDPPAIPMFRSSRSGKPIQLFNLQWAGQPEQIQQTLVKAGWQPLPKFTLAAAIYSITSDEKGRQLPYLPKLNNGKHSVLTMYKMVGTDNVLAVLRLWPADITFKDSNLPLLLGVVNYQLPRKHRLWKHKNYRAIKHHLTPATALISSSLPGYQVQQVLYSMGLRPKRISSHNEWSGGVLYIRPLDWQQ